MSEKTMIDLDLDDIYYNVAIQACTINEDNEAKLVFKLSREYIKHHELKKTVNRLGTISKYFRPKND